MIKVLYILHEDEKFGAPKALMDILLPLKDKGVYPIVLTHGKENVYRFCKKNRIKVISTGHLNIVCGNKNSIWSYLKFIPKLFLNSICDELAYIKLKRTIDLNEISFIHSNVSILSLGAKLRKKCVKSKYIVHLREPASITRDYLFTKGNLIKYLNKKADYFIGISKYSREQWTKAGIPVQKITTIYDGVVLPKFKPIKGILKNKILQIAVVGSLSTRKNQLIIIEAANLLPLQIREKIHITFIGSGRKYQNLMKDKIKYFKLEKTFSFLGYCTNLQKEYDKFDIGILASIGEPFGRVTIEYMAHGLLPIVSNSGANRELVTSNKTGILFDPKNSRELANILTNVVSNFKGYEKLRKKAQIRAYSKFTAETSAEELFSFYKNIGEI